MRNIADRIGDSILLQKDKIAYDIIKDSIIKNEFPPETMLVERNISESMNLSRTPIREAFKQLEAEGYVTKISGKGVFVTKIYYEDFLEIYEIKEALESQAARLCCMRKTDKVIADLEFYFRQYEKAVKEKRYELTQDFDIKFHETYINGAKNIRLEKNLKSVIEQSRRVLYFVKDIMPEYEYDDLLSQHENILNAIKSDNPELARQAVASHVEEVKNFIKICAYNR